MKLPAWLLAVITLIISSAIGVYYLNPALYKGLVPEGFFDAARKKAQAQCEADFNACMLAGTGNATCTTIYNSCTASAVAASASSASSDVSRVENAPSKPDQSSTSSLAALSTARAAGNTGDLGTGDTTFSDIYAAKQAIALSRTNMNNTDAYTKFLASLKTRDLTNDRGVEPTDQQLALAQGDGGYTGNAGGAVYKPGQQIIRAHMTPAQLNYLLTAKVNSDAGTQAQAIADGAPLTPSVRSQIRSDIKKAIADEIEEVNNEYEIQYDDE